MCIEVSFVDLCQTLNLLLTQEKLCRYIDVRDVFQYYVNHVSLLKYVCVHVDLNLGDKGFQRLAFELKATHQLMKVIPILQLLNIGSL